MKILDRIEQRMAQPGDSEFTRTQKVLGTTVLLFGPIISLSNATPMLFYGLNSVATLFALLALYFVVVDVVIISRPRSYDVLARLTTLMLVVVFAVGQVLYGGLASGMSSVHWNIIVVVSAVLFFGVRSSLVFLTLFFVALVVVVILEPFSSTNGPLITIEARQVLNLISLGSMGFVIFLGCLFLVSQLELYRRRSNDLLLNILPRPIATRLKDNPQTIADGFGEVSVLFADIVDFTTMSSGENPVDIVNLLNDIFSQFDDLAEKHGLEKIKTIGDAYMVAAGIPEPRPDHTQAIVEFAIDMLEVVETHEGFHGEPIRLRVGINTGPVVAGVIGRQKFIYDLWGDAVNVASRMESNGLTNQIQVTEAVKEKLDGRFQFVARDPIYIKGKGMMVTYLLEP